MSIKLDPLSRRPSILEVRFDKRLDVPPTQDQPRRTDGASSSRVEPEVYDAGKRIFIFACDSGLWGHQGRPRPSTVATMAVAV